MPLPTPPPDAASAALTLWRVTDGYLTTTWVEGTPHAPYPGEAQVCERFVALRPHQHDALLSRLARAESALREAEDRVAMECADLCRARADAYAKDRETLTGLEKVLVLAREAAALSCERAILTRFLSSPAAPGTGGTA